MPNFHTHLTFTGHISAVINTIKTNNKSLKLWILIQQYAVTAFQRWSKMILKIKKAYFSIFRGKFREIFYF